MSRVSFAEYDRLSETAKEKWDTLESGQKLTNMKRVLLQDEATYDAFMGWYKSWESLVKIVGERAAVIFAHSISTTNNCLLCSLFFISDLKAIGEEPRNLQLSGAEALLAELGKQIVKDPVSVPDALFEGLRSAYGDREIVAIVGFAAQMIATNNFNSVLQVDVDERLLPIRGEFEPTNWREDISK